MADNESSGFAPMPEGMRSAFETGIEQARAMFEQMVAASERAISTFDGSARALQSNTLEANRRVMAIAEQNVTASLEFAQRLARARDMQEMLHTHQTFVREQMERLGEQTRELTELARRAASPSAASPAEKAETLKGAPPPADRRS